MRKRGWSQTEFFPQRPEKYIGAKVPFARSSWELYFMKWCDTNPNVLTWANESITVPYRSPKDGKMHRYFPDFIIEYVKTDGSVQKLVIEIKPEKQMRPGTSKNRKTKAAQDSVYLVNKAKWAAAQRACDLNGYHFQVLNENQLFGRAK
jgi:Straboviridae/Kyanoviridae head completion nuclease